MNPATTNAIFEFQGNSVGGSGFNETITSTSFRAYHTESDSAAVLEYTVNDDLANGTDYQHLANGLVRTNQNVIRVLANLLLISDCLQFDTAQDWAV